MSAGEKTVIPRNPDTMLAAATRGVFLVAWVALHRCRSVPARWAARVCVVTDSAAITTPPPCLATAIATVGSTVVVVCVHPAVDVGDSGQIVSARPHVAQQQTSARWSAGFAVRPGLSQAGQRCGP
jgi:hypothetical protein